MEEMNSFFALKIWIKFRIWLHSPLFLVNFALKPSFASQFSLLEVSNIDFDLDNLSGRVSHPFSVIKFLIKPFSGGNPKSSSLF